MSDYIQLGCAGIVNYYLKTMIDPDNIGELNIGLLILLNSNVMSQVESLSECIHKCQKKETREKFQKSHLFCMNILQNLLWF